MHTSTLLLPTTLTLTALLTPLALTAPTSQSTPPYIGLSVYQGSASAPCASSSLSFNLKPPTSWLSDAPTAHCLPGTAGNPPSNITCVTRRTTKLAGDTNLDTNATDMSKCDLWGFTQPGCKGEYWVAGKNDATASKGRNGSDANGVGESWIWTEEERYAGAEVLDIRSWMIDCSNTGS